MLLRKRAHVLIAQLWHKWERMMKWLVDADTPKVDEPFQEPNIIQAEGATTEVINVNGQFYRTYTFTSSGLFVVGQPADMEVLCVGGGGAGGYGWATGTAGAVTVVSASTGETQPGGAIGRAGGGGGGAVLQAKTQDIGGTNLTPAAYAITVGAGGQPNETAGGDSKVSFVISKSTTPGDPFPTDYADAVANFSPFNDIYVAQGGGRGGIVTTTADDGTAGGSGGGGSSLFDSTIYSDDTGAGGRGVTGQGNSGADGIDTYSGYAGGGGGAAGPGKAGSDPDLGPDGGAGFPSSITGKVVNYGGGGGGCGINRRPGIGGLGGGGQGWAFFATPTGTTRGYFFQNTPVNTAGTDGFGGGGGAGGYFNLSPNRVIAGAQPGGSGVVIIRFKIEAP